MMSSYTPPSWTDTREMWTMSFMTLFPIMLDKHFQKLAREDFVREVASRLNLERLHSSHLVTMVSFFELPQTKSIFSSLGRCSNGFYQIATPPRWQKTQAVAAFITSCKSSFIRHQCLWAVMQCSETVCFMYAISWGYARTEIKYRWFPQWLLRSLSPSTTLVNLWKHPVQISTCW